MWSFFRPRTSHRALKSSQAEAVKATEAKGRKGPSELRL